MNRELLELRQVIDKLVPMLAGKGLKVTQRGSRAYVSTDTTTKKPVSVNIPNITENATPDFIAAIQGFIDHEISHVLITDWTVYGGSPGPKEMSDPKVKILLSLNNITEDTMIEREIVKIFPGSHKNLHSLRKHFIERITKPALASAKDPKEAFNYLMVPMMRALAGHVEFEEFMDEEKHWDQPFVKELLDKLSPAFLSSIKVCTTTVETLVLARELQEILYPPKPPKRPAPPPPPSKDEEEDDSDGESQDKPEEKAGEGDGDGERDHSDSEGDQDAETEADEDGAAEADGKPTKNDEEDEDGDSDPVSDEEGDDTADGDDDTDEDADGDEEAEDGDNDAGSDDTDGDGADDANDEPEADGSDDAEGDDGNDDTDAESDEVDDDGDTDSDSGDDADDAGDADGDDAGAGSGGGQDDDGDAEGGDNDATGDTEGDSAETDGFADYDEDEDDQSEGGGVGSSAAKSLFEFTEDAFDKVDISSAISEILSRDAAAVISSSDYKVFSTEADTIAPVNVPRNINDKWVPEMDEETQSMAGRMQKDIERIMASQSHVHHTPGHKRGKLHSPSLFRVMQGDPRVFTQKQQHVSKDTAVTLLVDNSGSMRGQKMKLGMISSYALSSTLERVKIAHEMLGFTTGGWASMPSSLENAIEEEYRATGMLYDRDLPIIMPVYKSFAERLSPEVKRRIAYMMNAQNGLQGNIDGESVQMALRRLYPRPEKRKVMIVLSDGQPAGGRNSGPHLKHVVEQAEKFGIEIIGIGIQDSAVKHYYKNHVVINNLADLPGQVMSEIKNILVK